MDKRKVISILLSIAMVVCSFAGCTAAKQTPQPTGTPAGETQAEAESGTVPVNATVAGSTTAASTTAAAGASAASTTKAAGVTVQQGTTQKANNAQGATTAKNAQQSRNNQNNNNGNTAKATTTAAQPQYIDIVLLKNRKAKCSSPNVSLATGEVVIDKAGDYRITSKTDEWHGKIVLKLKNTEKAELRFENVKIRNDTANIVQILDTSIKTNRSFLEAEAAAGTTADDEIKEISDSDHAPNVQISFPENTSSTFSTTANSITGVIYNESKLIIKGHGKALIKSERNANNCICSTKSIKIRNVSLNLTTAQNTSTSSLAKSTGAARGIFSYSSVTLESGYLNVKTNGDAIRCDDFISEGGTASLTSSACDAIDADDAIIINKGTITATALEKYSFKVRRINNDEKRKAGDSSISSSDCIRSGKGDTFAINGGTVKGESKKITTAQKASKQPVITCKLVKKTKKSQEEEKVAAVVDIKGVKKSSNKCTKFLYSSSGLKNGKKYTATANGNSGSATVNKTGIIEIISSRKKV